MKLTQEQRKLGEEIGQGACRVGVFFDPKTMPLWSDANLVWWLSLAGYWLDEQGEWNFKPLSYTREEEERRKVLREAVDAEGGTYHDRFVPLDGEGQS